MDSREELYIKTMEYMSSLKDSDFRYLANTYSPPIVETRLQSNIFTVALVIVAVLVFSPFITYYFTH